MSVFKGRGVPILAPNGGNKDKQKMHRNSMIVQLPPYKQKGLSQFHGETQKQVSLNRATLAPMEPQANSTLPQLSPGNQATFNEKAYNLRSNFERGNPSRTYSNYEIDPPPIMNYETNYSQYHPTRTTHERNNQNEENNYHQEKSTNIAPTFASLDIFNVTFEEQSDRYGRPTTSQLSRRPQYSQYITEETNTYESTHRDSGY